MPLLYDEPEPDLVGLGEGLATMRLPSSVAWNVIFKDSQLSGRVSDFVNVDAQRSFDAKLRRMTGYSEALDPEEANERFGIEGSLSFSKPVLEADAAWQQRRAQEREFKDYVLANADIGPLSAMGAAISGTLLDPISWPLMFAPELLGIAKMTQAAVGVRGGMAALKAGRLANAGRYGLEGAVEGAIGGAAYEGLLNYPLRQAEGENYEGGDALRNILLGAVFGAGAKGLLGAMLPPARKAGEAADPDAVRLAEDIDGLPETRLPAAVEALPEEQRSAAAVLAIDRMADDAPVDMGPVFEGQASATLRGLDEVPGAAGGLKARFLAEDVAVSTRGTEIPVRYALVEIDDLVTSHDNDLVRNGDYPAALQPRDRGDRAGSIASNRGLQGRLHPRLLLEGTAAETGSPIVSRDGVVESGNGRLIAMRRDADEGGAFWDRYREALAAAGYDTDGMSRPVLVRVRDSALSGEQRAALARELNPSMTEILGPREQAMADAAGMPAEVLEKLVAGPVDGAGNRAFARSFLEKMAPDQLNSLVDSGGRLSKDGADRLRAAVMAAAYGDGGLLEAVFEQADGHLKGIGQALADAAPAWARMRADMARGLTPPELDLTGNITAAVDLIRHAREQRMALPKLVKERTGQAEAFAELGLSRETLAMLELFYDNKAMTKPRDPALVAAFLDDYARQAQAKTPGPDLFGETHEGAARAILESLRADLGNADGRFGDILVELRARPVAKANAGTDAAGDAGAVLFDAGGPDGVGGGRGRGAGVEGAGGAQPDGPAPRRAADGVAEGGADPGPGAANRPAVRAPDANGNETLGLIDADHADLLLAGRRLVAGEAVSDAEWAALADRIGRYMDFTDVKGATAKGAFVDGGPSPKLMARAAKEYAEAMQADPSLGELSLYDPDQLEAVMRRGIKPKVGQVAGGAEPPLHPTYAADADLADDLTREAAAEKLVPVFEAADASGAAHARAVMGGVSRWLRETIGLTGSWRHTVDSSALRHIRKGHAVAASEKSRGQIAVTTADLARTPEIYADPDRMILGATNESGKPIVGYIKQLEDGSWLLVEEVRKRRYELALHSLRKYPATTNIEAITSTLRPNARSDGGDVLKIVDRPKQATPEPLSRPSEPTDAPQGGMDGNGVAEPSAGMGRAFIDADPELKALFEDTQAMLAREGMDGEAVAPARDPDTIAGAMRTAALCLLDSAEDLA